MPPKMIRSSRTVRSRQVRMLEPQASMDFKPVILILQCPISQKATCHRISDNHRDMEKVHKEEVQPWLWAARKGRRTKKALMCVNTGTKRDHFVRLCVCFALSCECVFATDMGVWARVCVWHFFVNVCWWVHVCVFWCVCECLCRWMFECVCGMGVWVGVLVVCVDVWMDVRVLACDICEWMCAWASV